MAPGKLRGPDSILLLSCYEMGHQPLGLASPAAFLRAAGFTARALDLPLDGLEPEAVSKAGFVGISVPMHTALRLGVRAARKVRTLNPAAKICFYGLYASLNAEYLLAEVADCVIGGEYEASLAELVRALDAGSSAPIRGVARRGAPAAPYLERLDFLVPLRTGLPGLDAYARLRSAGVDGLAGYVEATRGCKHLCLHCPIPPVYDGRFFVVPREVVLEDVRRLAAGGAHHITFGDPDFLNAPTHALRIARAMHEELPGLTFDFTAKVEHLLGHADAVRELARLGCLFVVSAVESLSDGVLANLEKGHTRVDVFRALELVRAAGLALRPSWVSFTPWTTLDDYLDVLEIVAREDLIDCVDPVQYAVRLLVPPGSRLLSSAAMRPHLRGLEVERFTYAWEHPDPRMDRLHVEVTRRVEAAAESGEDPAITFASIQDLAWAAAGRSSPPPVSIPLDRDRVRPPHLTEPWFC